MESTDYYALKVSVWEKLIRTFKPKHRLSDTTSPLESHNYNEDLESLLRVHRYLELRDTYTKFSPRIQFALRILIATLNCEDLFTKFAVRLAEDTKRAEEDESYRHKIDKVYLEVIPPSGDILLYDPSSTSGGDETVGMDMDMDMTEIDINTNEEFKTCLEDTLDTERSDDAIIHMEKRPVVIFAKMTKRRLAKYALDYVLPAIVTFTILYTGMYCVFHISEEDAASGVLNCRKVVFCFTFLLTFATLYLSARCKKRFTPWLLQIPEKRLVEGAYRFFGTGTRSSNAVINGKFRNLYFKYNVENVDSMESLANVCVNMMIIKLARSKCKDALKE